MAGNIDQDALDDLYTESLKASQHLLTKNGEFFPHGMTLGQDANLSMVAAYKGDEHPESQTVIDDLTQALSASASSGDIHASAIAVDIRIKDKQTGNPTDAVQIRIRAHDYARDVIVPYELKTSGLFKKTHEVQFFQPHATAAEQDIF